MLCIQVLLGGITRLTGSGLSITEWNMLTGAVPPISDQQWALAFDKYKQTPQFHLINADFSLSDFKFIFFWEWFHRLWARLVGVVFLVGFVGLVLKRKMKTEMIMPLLILFCLGMLQAVIGWIMVSTAALIKVRCSSKSTVGDSPVVPTITMPSVPSAICQSINDFRRTKSSAPSGNMGVTIATRLPVNMVYETNSRLIRASRHFSVSNVQKPQRKTAVLPGAHCRNPLHLCRSR